MATAQDSLYLKKEFVYKGDTLLYRVLFPDNYNHDLTYPLVVFLHGSGECGNDNSKQLSHGGALFSNPQNRKKYPAIVIFPQCPSNDAWINIKDKDKGTFEFVDKKEPTKSLLLTKKLIDFYKKTEAVDNKRIYISGISLGGMGTYDLICRYPDFFAAAVPICGAVNVDRLKKVHKTAISIYHGGSDPIVSVEYARTAYNKLKANDTKIVQFFEFPGIGHDCWDTIFAQPDFIKWIFIQKK